MNFQEKSSLLQLLYKTQACSSFVETGTYEGRMTAFMLQVVKPLVVRSIELNETLARQASVRFQAHANVKITQGDSNVELKTIMADPSIVRPLVWLDAHWSDGKTSRSLNGKDTPIVEELQAIKDSEKSCVVVIDDIRCFDGKNGYPTFGELEVMIAALWPETITTRVKDTLWFDVT